VSPVKYEQAFYIPEDILHSHRRENLKSYKYFCISAYCVSAEQNSNLLLIEFLVMRKWITKGQAK
jgi:hypothetical protein